MKPAPLDSSPESKPALVNILIHLSSSYELLNHAVKNVYLLYQTQELPCVIGLLPRLPTPLATDVPLSMSTHYHASKFFGMYTIALNVIILAYITNKSEL